MKPSSERLFAWRLLAVLMVLSTACVLPGVTAVPDPTPVLTEASATPAPATPTSVVKPRPTFTPTPEPEPTATPTPIADPRLDVDDVLVLPQPLYVGDHLSIDVDPSFPPGYAWNEDDTPSVSVRLPDGEMTSTSVSATGLDGVAQARFYWVDDVGDVDSDGSDNTNTTVYTLTLELPADLVDPDLRNNTVVVPMSVLPRQALLPPEPEASWAVTDTAGFSLHYITGSAAERDLLAILDQAAQAYEDIKGRFAQLDATTPAEASVEIYLLDRVVGQGGYASPDWVAVTYTDRAYSPVSLDLVFRHELTHRLDAAFGCDGAPALLREGLAVVMAGGHYRRESVRDKAAALFGSTHYIPLPDLAADFYTHQHEVGYLEAAAVVTYLVERAGWEVVPRLCRATSEADGEEDARWEAGLEEIGIAGSAILERQWRTWLQTSNVGPQDARLLELELRLMDAMRDYQLAYDPAAHFLEGILFSPAEAVRMEIVADFVRRPRDPEAITLELLLAMGQEALVNRDPALLDMLLSELIVAIAQGPDQASFAAAVKSVTQSALLRGWEPYRLILEAEDRLRVQVLNRSAWPMQSVLVARYDGNAWELSGTIGGE